MNSWIIHQCYTSQFFLDYELFIGHIKIILNLTCNMTQSLSCKSVSLQCILRVPGPIFREYSCTIYKKRNNIKLQKAKYKEFTCISERLHGSIKKPSKETSKHNCITTGLKPMSQHYLVESIKTSKNQIFPWKSVKVTIRCGFSNCIFFSGHEAKLA